MPWQHVEFLPVLETGRHFKYFLSVLMHRAELQNKSVCLCAQSGKRFQDKISLMTKEAKQIQFVWRNTVSDKSLFLNNKSDSHSNSIFISNIIYVWWISSKSKHCCHRPHLHGIFCDGEMLSVRNATSTTSIVFSIIIATAGGTDNIV